MKIEQHVDALKSKNNSIKKIDPNVFQAFKQITNKVKRERINGALELLKHLNVKQNIVSNEAERAYSLQRLVRGLGASTTASKVGFYTTLVTFLNETPNDEYPQASDLFTLMQKQLNFGSVVDSKEDADALIGHILVCGALLHSKKLLSKNDIVQCTQSLIDASHHRSYHSSMAYAFLLELLEEFDEKSFIESIWPLMKKELKRKWEKQNLNTINYLMKIQLKYPQLIDEEYLQSSIQSTGILTPNGYKMLGKLYWSPSSLTCAGTHPSYDTFADYLTKVPTKNLLQFWQNEVNEQLKAFNQLKQIATLRILTVILNSGKLTPDVIEKLLTNTFIKKLSETTIKNQEKSLKVFLLNFYSALEKYFGTIDNNENGKCEIIKRFIYYPGSLTFDKHSTINIVNKMITKLGADGIVQLYEFYKQILIEKCKKNPENPLEKWSNGEKLLCITMMQNLLCSKSAHTKLQWRIDELKFFLKISLFYVDGVTRENLTTKEHSLVPVSIAYAAKQSISSLLLLKDQNSNDEQKMLMELAKFLNNEITSNAHRKKFRQTITDDMIDAWKKMYAHLTPISNGKNTNLTNVFNVLLLHMGFQLFKETRFAIEAINDLIKCMDRAQMKKKTNASNEIHWIEVIVDLFMHLLSLNSNLLRNVVGHVFPRLCSSLTLSSVHQILSMLDMKVINPLSVQSDTNEEEENEKQDDSSAEEGDESEAEGTEEGRAGSENEETGSSDEDDEEMDSDIESDMDNDATITDELRNAVSQALGAAMPDTDNDSVDLNDMDDEDGKKLDEALSNAFKVMRKQPDGDPKNKKKKSKKERTIQTVVMHFRIRILDMVEVYLKQKPSLSITLETLLALVAMLDHCQANKDLKSLSERLNHILRTLLSLRRFSDVHDVTEENLVDTLNAMLACKAATDEQNNVMTRSIVFLLNACDQLNDKTNKIGPLLHALHELIDEHLKSRNSKLSPLHIQELMKARGSSLIWIIGADLAKSRDGERLIRRRQAIDYLTLMYKNHGYITSNSNEFNQISGQIENELVKFIKQFVNKIDPIDVKLFESILSLLIEIYQCSKFYTCKINWEKLTETINEIHRKTPRPSHAHYNRLCKLINVEPLKLQPIKLQNGKQNGELNLLNGNRKRKVSESDELKKKQQKLTAKKLKMQKKEKRLQVASEGLGEMSFTGVNGDADVNDVESE